MTDCFLEFDENFDEFWKNFEGREPESTFLDPESKFYDQSSYYHRVPTFEECIEAEKERRGEPLPIGLIKFLK